LAGGVGGAFRCPSSSHRTAAVVEGGGIGASGKEDDRRVSLSQIGSLALPIHDALPATDIEMKYYDLQKNWRKVRRHIDHPEVQSILVRDFNKYTWGQWRRKFEQGMVPTAFESCDWQLEHRGKRPAFWRYTKHAACHWLVNFALRLAQLVEPKRTWRIITSQKHSTVWDGEDTLFDFNFLALGIEPAECFELAHKKVLKPGQYRVVHWAEHWRSEMKRSKSKSK
jgi:hypothetical protein